LTVLGPAAAKKGVSTAAKKALPEQDRLKAQKYFKLYSGYYDEQKKIVEMNMCGAVCHQLVIMFEFDKQKAEDLIQKCKEIQS